MSKIKGPRLSQDCPVLCFPNEHQTTFLISELSVIDFNTVMWFPQPRLHTTVDSQTYT